MQQRTPANTVTGYSVWVPLSAAVEVVFETVKVVVTGEVDVGVTLDGLKVHAALAGKPTHANLTAALNPFTGVIDRVAVALLLPVTVNTLEAGPVILKVCNDVATGVTE